MSVPTLGLMPVKGGMKDAKLAVQPSSPQKHCPENLEKATWKATAVPPALPVTFPRVDRKCAGGIITKLEWSQKVSGLRDPCSAFVKDPKVLKSWLQGKRSLTDLESKG